jgi:hypothetical protein
LRPDGNHAEQATARLDRPSNSSEEDQRSSPAEKKEAREPVEVPAAALSRKRRYSVVDFLQYSLGTTKSRCPSRPEKPWEKGGGRGEMGEDTIVVLARPRK